MLIVKIKIDSILKNKDISYYKLSKLVDYDVSYLHNIFKGKNPFPEDLIKKLLLSLEIPREELESWILTDKYSKEVLKLAIQTKKNFPYKRKSILTTKIDFLLHEKGLSRTDLSKEIKYSQSSLNQMIIGKRNISKSVLERISQALEIPQDAILSWSIADKYSLEVLERACLCKPNA